MSGTMVDAFFYGLYMDENILRDKGVQPRLARKAAVPGYRLRIGKRATLIPQFGTQVLGMVFALSHPEVHSLYAGAGLDMYRPESVIAVFENGSFAPVTTFNLVEPPAEDEKNPDYSAKLRVLLERLGFSDDYIRSVI
jgi:hypothetical protein